MPSSFPWLSLVVGVGSVALAASRLRHDPYAEGDACARCGGELDPHVPAALQDADGNHFCSDECLAEHEAGA